MRKKGFGEHLIVPLICLLFPPLLFLFLLFICYIFLLGTLVGCFCLSFDKYLPIRVHQGEIQQSVEKSLNCSFIDIFLNVFSSVLWSACLFVFQLPFPAKQWRVCSQVWKMDINRCSAVIKSFVLLLSTYLQPTVPTCSSEHQPIGDWIFVFPKYIGTKLNGTIERKRTQLNNKMPKILIGKHFIMPRIFPLSFMFQTIFS